jgi:hypothetical protein
MLDWHDRTLHDFGADEASCLAHLFAKRWPGGFQCPFCGTWQRDIAPAYTVVCRVCRKQTSITANTLMHGSKKNLVAWLLVARQFCLHHDGLSARELQRLLELSCYQTAWRWLQKLRAGAALAESAPCRGVVLFDLVEPEDFGLTDGVIPTIGVAMELQQMELKSSRIRLHKLETRSSSQIVATILDLVQEQATLLINIGNWSKLDSVPRSYLVGHPSREHVRRMQRLLEELTIWLNTLYRATISSNYLQSYLDEFCFRHNTASWPDRRAVLDHLINGLVTPLSQKVPATAKGR